jgi:cytochrome b561
MTRTHFNPLLRIVHWTMALLILAMLFMGVGMVSTAGPAYPAILRLHRPLGIAILMLAVLRLLLRWMTGAPPLPPEMPRMQRAAAKASHLLLYAAMIGLPLIGWGMLSAGGYPIELAGGVTFPPILPHDLRIYYGLRVLHTVAAIAFFALILLHLAAALVHGLIRRDGVMESITFGTRRVLPGAKPDVDHQP